MKKVTFLAILCLTTFFVGCQNQDQTEPEPISEEVSLVFGTFGGFCAGNCTYFYKIENNHLFQDLKPSYDNYDKPDIFYLGNFTLADDKKFQSAKDLLTDFPQELLNEKSTKIGSDFIADINILYVEYNYEGIRKYWLINGETQTTPAYLHPFINKLNDKTFNLHK